jgi:hypothetical protein
VEREKVVREREWLAAVGEGEEEGKYSAGRKATLSTFSCCTLSFRDQDAAERIKNSPSLCFTPQPHIRKEEGERDSNHSDSSREGWWWW